MLRWHRRTRPGAGPARRGRKSSTHRRGSELRRGSPFGPVRHERELHDIGAYPVLADVDLDSRPGLGLCLREISGADGGVRGWGDGPAAHHIDPGAVEPDIVAVAPHLLRLGDPESHEAPRDALELLLLQGDLPRERRVL